MPQKATSKPGSGTSQSSATIGFEAKLWLTADKLRNNMDAVEYKQVLGALKGMSLLGSTRSISNASNHAPLPPCGAHCSRSFSAAHK